jgi:oxygen-dependent protoporphyrinogen oxidase
MNTHLPDKKRVAVIGAGIAGLAAAYELKQHGIEATVFEKAPISGGRMVTQKIGNLLFDAGADFFSDNYTQMKAYAHEFNIPWVPYERHCAQRFMRDGKTHILHLRGMYDILFQPLLSISARASLIFWLAKISTIRLPLDFFDLSAIPGHYDSSTAENYINQNVHPEINDYIADPFTGAMQFHRTNEMSAGAIIAVLQMTMSKNRKFTPRYTTGGIAKISQALADRVSINYGSKIKSIKSNEQPVEITMDDNTTKVFDAIICATPAYETLSMLTRPTTALKAVLGAAKYSATITIALKVPADLDNTSHCTYVPYKENSLIGSYTFEENKSSDFADKHHGVMNVYLREEFARELMDKTDQEIFSRIIDEMPKICPELSGHKKEVSGLALYRWPQAMPKFDYQYISTVRDYSEKHQGEDGIYLAGDYFNAPWTEGAARSGIRAAKAIIAAS